MPLTHDAHRMPRPVKTRLYYIDADGVEREGQNPQMIGIAAGLWGDCTGMRGDCTAKRGDLSLISEEGRRLSPMLDLWMAPQYGEVMAEAA